MSGAELARRLLANLKLYSRMEALLLAIDNEAGKVRRADATEMRVIDGKTKRVHTLAKLMGVSMLSRP